MGPSGRVGNTWRGLIVKCVLRVAFKDVNAEFRTKELTGGVEADIWDGTHVMCLLWAQNYQNGDWGFLLVDARIAFNE